METDNKDITPSQVPLHLKEDSKDKLLNSEDFKSFAFSNLIELLNKETTQDASTVLAEARVYAKMLKKKTVSRDQIKPNAI